MVVIYYNATMNDLEFKENKTDLISGGAVFLYYERVQIQVLKFLYNIPSQVLYSSN